MAILSNLLVNGTSRLLGKLYCSDLDVSSDLSISGKLSIPYTGLYINGKKAIWSDSTTDTWLRINGTNFSSGIYLGSSRLRTDGELQVGNSGTYFKSNSTATTIANLVSPSGNITTLRSGSGTFDDVNVTNTLRATRFDLESIASTGGSLYISPTIKFPNSGGTLTVTKSSTALTLVITDSSITTADLAGITWTANSRVKVSGTINGVVTGTMDGTITSINTSSHVLTLSVSGENWNNVVAGEYSASQFSDLSVMVYQRKVGSNDYRVGIWLNCYDMSNSSATMRIYGGTSSLPNVMLGNLTNAGLGTVNEMTPTGWGLFAQNAFLHGHIVANAGKIGGFTLGTESMYSSNNNPATNNFYLMPTGSQSATYNIAGSGALSNWVMTSGTTFGVTKDGKIYATAGKIGGFTLSAAYMYGNATAPAANNLFLMPAGTSSSYTVAGVATTGWTITSGTTFGVTKAGAMYSTSGKIGGWSLSGSNMYNGYSLLQNDQIIVANSDYTAGASLVPNLLTIGGATTDSPRAELGLTYGSNGWYPYIRLREGAQADSVSWGFMPDASFWSNGEINANEGMNCRGYDGGRRRVVCSGGGDGGRVGYIFTGTSNAFSVCGQFGTAGSTYVTRKVTMTTSDVRLKENISNTNEKGLGLLNNVRLVSFDWKDTHEHKSIGIVADELEQLNPELVAGGGYDEDGNMDIKAIDTLQLLSYTIKAIQEQQAEIETLKKQLVSLQQK